MIGWAATLARRLAAEGRERRRWTPLRDTSDIRVYYGMDRLPAGHGPISGGMVKCLDLARRFPNTADHPNLLYLVSSALPARRELLTRAAGRAGGRVVLNQNGVAYSAWAGEEWQKQNAPNARVHAAADFVIYQSEFCRRCAERFLGPRKGPGEVLYNPVDTQAFSPAAAPRSGAAPRLLVAGSHHDDYRVKHAMVALSLLLRRGGKAELLVAGRLVWAADAEAQARRWADELGIGQQVAFLGAYTQTAAPDLFRSADLLLHLKVQDPCPRLVVEAMACGLPVVYVATGGTPELVGDEAGIGIPGTENFDAISPPEPAAVADAADRLLRGLASFSACARTRAIRRFGLEPWLRRHEEIFESL